uniref:inositol-phosphate phosphatase n=1 Tax=Aceria tosichella TaxID=561515 RepID=A0A6G1SHF5_9ACAR
MDSAEQVNLLANEEQNPGLNPTTMRNNGSHFPLSKSIIRKNILLLVLLIFIITCLTFYFYLNLVAFDETQSSRYKPLSRRRPILDHESIFSDSGPSMIQFNDLLAHCIVALQIAGKEVVRMSLLNNEHLNHVGSKGKTKEGVDDVVTGADMKSHEMIVNTLKDSYRRLKVVSEEDTTKSFDGLLLEDDILPIDRTAFANHLRNNLHEIEREQKGHGGLIVQDETLVWIDPLDATKEYSENLTDYVTLMACIVHKAAPIAGVIHKPFANLTYWSFIDESSKRTHHSTDLRKIISAGRKQFSKHDDNIDIIVSRSHAGDVKNVLEKEYGDKVSITAAGGSGYKTVELISGNVDAYVHMTHIKKWDICAPQAILNSIRGANLTDLRGKPIAFHNPKDKVVTSGLIATMDAVNHESLVKSFKDTIVGN